MFVGTPDGREVEVFVPEGVDPGEVRRDHSLRA